MSEPSEPVTIEVCERLMDRWTDWSRGEPIERSKYHAQVKGEPGLWGCGKTVAEAIGEVVRCHAGRFGVAVEDLGRLAR